MEIVRRKDNGGGKHRNNVSVDDDMLIGLLWLFDGGKGKLQGREGAGERA